jgi:hypothetical protein
MPVSDMETRSEAQVIVCSAGLDGGEDMDCGEYWPEGSLGQHDCWIPDADSTYRLVRPRQKGRITDAKV